MSKRRLVITAVLSGQSQSEVARAYGVSQGWISRLMARYRLEGRRRSSRCPVRRTPARARPRRSTSSWSCGCVSGWPRLVWTPARTRSAGTWPTTTALALSRATINRILVRAGVGRPGPVETAEELLHPVRSRACRTSAGSPTSPTTGSPTATRHDEILTWLDDCSRYALSVTAHARVTGPIVLATFRKTVATAWRSRPRTLTDNGMVFTTRFSGGKGGRNHLETRAPRPHITQKNGQPNHPQTQGKVERFQQTLKKWLRAQPDPTRHPRRAADPPRGLHRRIQPPAATPSLPHQATPATIYTTLPKATPTTDRAADSHDRVRHDKIDKAGSVTLRVAGQLRHIGVGRTYARTDVILLVHDLHVRVVNAATGELLRELTIDPRQDYQPTGRPPGPPQKEIARTCTSQVRAIPMS